MAKVRAAAVSWLTEMSAVDAIQTDEEIGRAMADEARRHNVTLDEALSRLGASVAEFCWADPTRTAMPGDDPVSRAKKALRAGADRLAYFAAEALVRKAMEGLE
ncbi:hypothetical protein HLH36_19260 [Gluconacetobacter aggeris]|uniref:Uncharacterized protein n=1 Tax=Gluconacetobacter aggeris TaxID=1286186 RepID=A0A7W4IWN8_9PROT|nr:hypothetical protein [Gluconacetobacter aggeris]